MNPDPSSDVIAFLSHLAERLYWENNLSDVTWALCQANPNFAAALAQFVGLEVPKGGSVRVEREVYLGDGNRIDIACRLDAVTAFVEVKIYNRDHHLSEYAERVDSIPDSRLALLTNHPIDPKELAKAESLGCKVLRWNDFVSYLQQRLPDDDALLNGYVGYVRKVCNMIDMRDIRLDTNSLYSLVCFHALVEETIPAASHDEFTYSLYRPSRNYGPGWTGANFRVQYQHGDIAREAWPFFGLRFDAPGEAQLMVRLDRDWNAKFLEVPLQPEGLEADLVLCNGNAFGIAAPKDELHRLLTLPLAEQRQPLASLFRNLMKPIEQRLADPRSYGGE